MFGEEVSTLVTSPATKNFLELMKDAEKLSENKGEFFHLLVEKLLFIMNSYRPDLEMAVGFLKIRVSKSDVEDWGN